MRVDQSREEHHFAQIVHPAALRLHLREATHSYNLLALDRDRTVVDRRAVHA